MRENKPSFICFNRLRDISLDCFIWAINLHFTSARDDVMTDEKIVALSSEQAEEILAVCKFDIIRFDEYIILRFDDDHVVARTTTNVWEYEDDFLPAHIASMLASMGEDLNPLRFIGETTA